MKANWECGETMSGRAVYFEIAKVGNYVKVTAIDSATAVEASIVASPRLTTQQLKAAALRKLEYVLEKRAGKR